MATSGHNGQQKDIIRHSVTQGDQINDVKKGGANSIYYFNVPFYNAMSAPFGVLSATSGLPVAWSHYRDAVLRSSVYIDGEWASVVGMFATRIASTSWELKGIRIQRYQELLLSSWTSFIYKLARDFTTTDNGMFIEVVRASSAAGSRILGLVPLDSVRTTRTGDPNYPAIYRDLKGVMHEMRDYQVMMLSDMPDSSERWWDVGLSAASRAWDSIITLIGIKQLVQEKILGSDPTAVSFINASIDDKQLQSSIDSGKEKRVEAGYTRLMGVIMIPIVNFDSPPSIATLQLKGLPDGFDSEQERENCQRNFALALGLDPQIVNPRLIGSGSRGTSAQSKVLKDEQQGFLPVLFKKELTHLLNQYVLPGTVAFNFNVKDLDERLTLAKIQLTDAQTRAMQIQSGELTPQQALIIAVQNDEAPASFVSPTQIEQPLSDYDQPQEIDEELQAPVQEATAQPDPNLQMKQHVSAEAIQRALNLDEASLTTQKEWADRLRWVKEQMELSQAKEQSDNNSA